MASSSCDELVIPEEVQRKERRVEFARENVHTCNTREALVVVAKALFETGKDDIDKNQMVDALVEALQLETGKEEEEEAATERPFIDRLFDEYEFVDDDFFDEEEVDEELAKKFAEVQESFRQMWIDCVNKALKAGVQFAPPSHPHCLIACDDD